MWCVQTDWRSIATVLCLTYAALFTPAETAAASFEKLVMPGPVSAAHAEFEDTCSACHAPLDETTQLALCGDCHERVAADIHAGLGFHGRHPQVASNDCQSCHREHEGRDAQTLRFDMQTFTHTHTDFPLTGSHAALECASCHAPGSVAHEAPAQCAACHAEDDVHAGAFGSDCASCHNASAWQTTKFDHASTGFALLGAHTALQCSACHGDATVQASSKCASCHSKDDVHKGAFGTTCEQCHSQKRWTPSLFDHLGKTGFALTGGHGGLTCAACHEPGDRLKQLNGSTCMSCHADDDPHGGAFGNQCSDCHTTADWHGKPFQHEQMSGFALLGAHQSLSCEACHEEGLQTPETACVGCHKDPHAGQLGNTCDACHETTHFTSQVLFDHSLTSFPLVGRHAELTCLTCHASARFHDAGETCASCHAEEDVHAGRLGEQCAQCHNPATWDFTHFDHGASTNFQLTGAHAEARCESCHASPVMMQAQNDSACHQCHRKDDLHGGNFGADCAACHTTSGFSAIERR